MAHKRADDLAVAQGLAATRDEAARLIMAGQVRHGTRVLVTPSTPLPADAELTLDSGQPYVSRGGEKLAAALDAWPIEVAGRACLDVGASTGGFTDCLLQRGAASVVAVDVGRGLLHASLRSDPRVAVLEGVNARDLPDVGAVDLFVGDLSFISLRVVLPAVSARVPAGTEGVVLFKPQYEAAPGQVPPDGVIREAAVREAALADFVDWAGTDGWDVRGTTTSPITGAKGNVEYLVWLMAPGNSNRA